MLPVAANLRYMYIHTASIHIARLNAVLPPMLLPHSVSMSLVLLLVVTHLLGLLQQPRCVVNSAECTYSGVDALVHQVSGDDDPEKVHQNKVAPVVRCFRAGVRDV